MKRFLFCSCLMLSGCAALPPSNTQAPAQAAFLLGTLNDRSSVSVEEMDRELTRYYIGADYHVAMTPLTGSLFETMAAERKRRPRGKARPEEADDQLKQLRQAYGTRVCFDVFLRSENPAVIDPYKYRFVWATLRTPGETDELRVVKTDDPIGEVLSNWTATYLPLRGYYAHPRTVYGKNAKYTRQLMCGTHAPVGEAFQVSVEPQDATKKQTLVWTLES